MSVLERFHCIYKTLNSVTHSSLFPGRAFLVQTSDGRQDKLYKLAQLAVDAGFDWVYYKDDDHIHISVIPDGKYVV